MKKSLAVASVLLMASPLAGCGNSSSSGTGSGSGTTDYCSAIQSVKDQVSNVDFTALTQSQFDDVRGKIGDIESVAPSDVQGDWKTLGDFLDQFQGLLNDAGISFDDLQAMQSGKVPSGLDMAKLQQLGTKLQSLTSKNDITTADKAIKASAKSVCNINMDSTSGPPSSSTPSS